MHYYKFNVGNYYRRTHNLSLLEDLAYRRMLDTYYLDEKPFPNDIAKIARKIGMRDSLDEVSIILEDYFLLQDDLWHNEKADEQIEAYQANAEVNKLNGKKGGRPRKITQPVTDGNPSKSEPKGNNKQLTINNKQLTNKEIVIPDGININSWNEWSAYRKSKKKAISQIAATKQFKMLAKYSIDQQKEIIDKSITGDYQGLFDLNEAKGSIDETIPYDLIAIAYNNHFADSVGVSQVADMSDSRKSMIAKIWNHKPDQKEKPTSSVNFFERYFAHCSTRPNLNGENDFFGESGLSKLVNWNTYIDILEKK